MQAVGLVLILLNLTDNLGNLPTFGEIDELRVVQEIRVSLLQEQNVGLIMPEEWNTWRVDGTEFLQVEFKMVVNQAGCILKGLYAKIVRISTTE